MTGIVLVADDACDSTLAGEVCYSDTNLKFRDFD